MSDPKRLLDSSGPGLERALLESGLEPDPTEDQREAIWNGLALGFLGSGDTPTGPTRGAHRAPRLRVTSFKAAGALLAVGGAVSAVVLASVHALTPGAGGHPMATASTAPPVAGETSAPIPPVATALSEPERASGPSIEPGEHERGTAPARPANARSRSAAREVAETTDPSMRKPPASAASASPPDALELESRAVVAARGAIHAGNCDGARALLDDARTRFPSGALFQEREALSIEALACSGRDGEASARAAAFLRDYPSSPHAAVLRRFLR
jgi:hypothetical protein